MDWLHTIFLCFVWIVAVVAAGVTLYVVVALPIALITAVVGIVYGFFRLFLPFLPDFWESVGSTAEKKSGFDWGERTEADKHRELVEHIRIQNMNEERNRR
ncbi:TPA: hypothetical protein ACFRG8_001894 [Neisseria lactamica]|uniref:hypothetical protein n=1 Tax=Neisseria lactamica TaxID=486 RepID=UPI0002D60D38|nr:hypothetical protein [Neisseria lactamica]